MFLATTALEKFWNKKDKILFLGEWCKLYDRKYEIESLDSKMLEFEWNDLEKQKDAIIYCNEVYENILDEMVVILNNYHNINQDKKYWRMLLSSWLLPFIQVAYDKYIHIKKAINIDSEIYSYVLNASDYYTPANFSDFMRQMTNNEQYHLQIYSQIFINLSLNYKVINSSKKQPKNKIIIINKEPLREKVLRVSTAVLNKLFNKKSTLITSVFFKKNTLQSILRLLFKSRFSLLFNNMNHNINIKEDASIDNRKILFKNNIDSDFQRILNNIFVYNFPIIFLEGYKNFDNKVSELSLQVPNLAFSSSALHGNDIFKFFVAKNKIKLLYRQHGGGYGLELLSSPEKIERDSADIFYTQGWSEGSKTIPLSLGINKDNITENYNINFIMTAMPRYVYRFNFSEDSSKMMVYIENSKQFLSNLKILNNLTIRQYKLDYKWNIKARLLEVNKNLKFDNKTNYYKQIAGARLNIFDHMHTGYLETLSINVPTIIIIPKDVYCFRDGVKPYIRMLKDAKILFEDPIEASNFVNEIYNDIEDWWLSNEVQKVRAKFCHQYSRTSENWEDEWVEEFNRIMILSS